MTTCPACPRTQVHGLLCHHCTTQLERDLADVPKLLAELDTTLAKQGRTDTSSAGGLARERTGYHEGASNAHRTLTRTLIAWSRGIGRPTWYATTAATNLLDGINDLRAHGDADKLHAEITTAVAAARRTYDVPANRTVIPVGPCPECSSEVHAYFPTDDRPPRLECRDDPAHRWDCTQWLRVGRRILDRMAAIKATA